MPACIHRYKLRLRPVSFSTLPPGIRWTFIEAPAAQPIAGLPTSRHRYGVIATDRPLTAEEMRHWDIEEDSNGS